MPGPLAGVKVFEVSQIVAGPYCGLNLADLGADVIKVEPPGGEGSRAQGAVVPGESKGFHALNRGKRSLVVDLQHPGGQALVHRIIPGFDVFTINARPGVPERLRVDYDTLREFRPDLIHLENSGFGNDGPSKTRSGSDAVAQAYSGLLAGDGKVDAFGAPEIISATAPADFQAGLAGTMAICAALFHRAMTGEGQAIETSLLMAGLAMQGFRVSQAPALDAFTTDIALQARCTRCARRVARTRSRSTRAEASTTRWGGQPDASSTAATPCRTAASSSARSRRGTATRCAV